MYRRASVEPVVKRTIPYGPFPLAWWKLALAPGLWFVGLVLILGAEMRQQITCGEEHCAIETRAWRRPPAITEGGRELIKSAQITERSQAKGGAWRARVKVDLSKGGYILLDQEPQEKAEVRAAQINDFVAGKARAFTYDSGDLRWLNLVSALLFLLGGGLIADALRRRQALSLQLDGRSITVSELGLFRRRFHQATLRENVRDVVVNWHLLEAAGSKSPAVWGATLEAENADGTSTDLTTIPRRGLVAHYEAAAALREALGWPAGPIRASCPDPNLTSPPFGGLVIGIIVAVWFGLCCGSLAGVALYVCVLILLNPVGLRQPPDEGLMAGAAFGALGLAALAISIVWARNREQARYRLLAGLVLSPGHPIAG